MRLLIVANVMWLLFVLTHAAVGQEVTVSGMLDPDTGRPSAWNGTHRLVETSPDHYEARLNVTQTIPVIWFDYVVRVGTPYVWPRRLYFRRYSGRWYVGTNSGSLQRADRPYGWTELTPFTGELSPTRIGNPMFVVR